MAATRARAEPGIRWCRAMAELVTLEQAKKRARYIGCDEDDDLRLMLLQAHEIVLRYLADTTNTTWTATIAAWTDETVPADVQVAIQLQFKALDASRGDSTEAEKFFDIDGLAHGVKGILRRLRAPVIA